MTDDQHRAGQQTKAQILLADRLEAWGLTDPHERAAWLLDRLQTDLGWRAPIDPGERPPLRPAQPAPDDSPGRRAFREARAELAHRRRARTTSTTSTNTPDTPQAT